MHEAHEGLGCFLAAQGNTSKALEPVEEAFDLVAFFVEPPVDRRRTGSAGVGLDLRGCSERVGDELPQRARVVGRIGDDVADAVQARQ